MVINADYVHIVSHIDADGITAAAIAVETCKRLDKPYDTLFVNKLNEDVIGHINNIQNGLVWICDLGSGYLSGFKRDNILITDHHVPESSYRNGQTFLDSFIKLCHINPHKYGLDGSVEVSGAGVTYLVSKEICPDNTDLAKLAIVGACGDVQDGMGELDGINREILADAMAEGDIDLIYDLKFFGRNGRSLVQFLQLAEKKIPVLGDDNVECKNFFEMLEIPLIKDDKRRSWADLTDEERERASSAVLRLFNNDKQLIFGEIYLLPNSTHNDLMNTKEYATLLNSCGRYDDAETGLRICLGDESAVEAAKKNRVEHRQNIAASIALVKEKQLVKIKNSIQYFDAGADIKDTVVGIVAGMILSSDGFRKDLPIIAFADSDDGVKVSARANRGMINKGLDLSSVMKIASEVVGGYGGGHSIAAGASIPKGKEKEFLNVVDEIVSSQLFE